MKHTVYIPSQSRGRMLELLCVSSIAGILVGAFLQTGRDTSPPLWLHQFFSPALSGDTPAEVFRNTLTVSAAALAAYMLAGLSAVGQPFALGVLALRSAGIGASAALEYSLRGTGALLRISALLLPKSLALLAVSMLAAREALRSSNALLSRLTSSGGEDKNQGLRLYCVRFAVLAGMSLFVSAADSVMNYLFARLVK